VPSVEREVEMFRFFDRLAAQFKAAQDAQQVLRHVTREAVEALESEAGCIAVSHDDASGARLLFAVPRTSTWDLDLMARFIRDERPTRPDDLLLAPIARRRSGAAALAIARPGRPFDRRERRLLARAAGMASDAVQAIDRERLLEVRDRIDRKIREQLHPKDLFYQILDGLRSLTQYDHSSALLIRESRGTAMEVAAEQIAWTKGKSVRIGRRLALDDAVASALASGTIYGFDRREESWVEWSRRPCEFLARWVEFSDGLATGEPREASLLCAPLVGRDGLFGVLKIAALQPGRLTPHDAELVERFRWQAVQAIDSLNRMESLQARMLAAERRHAMAELARGVSHDVNNALGSMLPLVQQMREDVRSGAADTAALEGDLEQMEQSLQVCRRIFGGMLAFARGDGRRTRTGHVRTAVETTLAILRDSIERRGIHLAMDVPAPDELPLVACAQSELEQTLLNLLTNARDASRQGDRISVQAELAGSRVEIAVADTGRGIAQELIPRVVEPFFTTKGDGNGLGLTICRSIVWEAGGTMDIRSAAGVGTTVSVSLPCAPAPVAVQP
jgi:signal transduction histidine kinase